MVHRFRGKNSTKCGALQCHLWRYVISKLMDLFLNSFPCPQMKNLQENDVENQRILVHWYRPSRRSQERTTVNRWVSKKFARCKIKLNLNQWHNLHGIAYCSSPWPGIMSIISKVKTSRFAFAIANEGQWCAWTHTHTVRLNFANAKIQDK
jgi:hypothetical protein